MAKKRNTRKFWKLAAEAKRIHEGEIDPLLPVLAEARRKYMRSRTKADRAEMDRVQKIASDLIARHAALGACLFSRGLAAKGA